MKNEEMTLEQARILVKEVETRKTWLEFSKALAIGYGRFEFAATLAQEETFNTLVSVPLKAVIQVYGPQIQAAHDQEMAQRTIKLIEGQKQTELLKDAFGIKSPKESQSAVNSVNADT